MKLDCKSTWYVTVARTRMVAEEMEAADLAGHLAGAVIVEGGGDDKEAIKVNFRVVPYFNTLHAEDG